MLIEKYYIQRPNLRILFCELSIPCCQFVNRREKSLNRWLNHIFFDEHLKKSDECSKIEFLIFVKSYLTNHFCERIPSVKTIEFNNHFCDPKLSVRVKRFSVD